MSDLYLRALMQSLLGGSSSMEENGLLAEVCRRIILSGINFSSLGALNLVISSFGPSVIANLGATGVIGDVPYYDSTTTLARLADVAAGNVLLSGGVGAAPAYGKVANSHVDVAAAIAYSKLNLATSIVNADIALAAAIAYSKLNLATSIVNGDINAAAAIAWSKLDKAGSSLADLTTKSAAALTSGLLADARLPGFTSDGASRITQLAFLAAQSASADANTLDDYEEGVWTPVIGGSGGTSGQTYTIQVGEYVKIGKIVIAQFTVGLTAKGTITASVQIQGLPFTAENTVNVFSVCAPRFANLATNWVSIIALVNTGQTTADIQGCAAAAAGNNTALVTADIGNTSQFIGTLIYRATA